MKKIIYLTFVTGLFSFACCAQSKVDNSPVTGAFSLEKYLGSWYEIARFDHPFERGISQCKAEYTLMEDGTVRVLNSGIKGGKPKVAKGKAKLTKVPAVLRVSFFGPFYSDYRIMMLAQDYSYALVGSGSADYLWILSRSPRLEDNVRKAILDEAVRRGYDTTKLIWVKQDS